MLTLFVNPYDTSFREEESSWQVPTSNVQADLIDVSRLSRYNRGFKFLLTCIDVFSKQAWVVPLKDKTGTTLVNAFESIRSPLPQTLQTDKGSEFTNRKFQQWLKEHQVHFFTTENEDIKASIEALVWHLWTSRPRTKPRCGFDSMPTPFRIKNLCFVWETQFASVRRGGRSKKVISPSGPRKSSPSSKGKAPTPYLSTGWLLRWNTERDLLSSRATKGIKKGRHLSYRANSEARKRSSFGKMERISRQVQQLGASQRPALMWCLSMGLLLFGYGLALWFVTRYVHDASLREDRMNCSRLLRGEKDYVYVIRLNESYKKPVDTTQPSVWWRTTRGVHGVVPEVAFLEEKSSICVKCCWFCPSSLLASTIWPTNGAINNCGWHYWAVAWAICFPTHQSNHEQLLFDITQQQLNELLWRQHFGKFYNSAAQHHRSGRGLGSRVSGDSVSS